MKSQQNRIELVTRPVVNQTVAEKVFQKAADCDGVIVSTVKCHASFLKAYARFISSAKEKDEAASPAAVRSCVDKLWQYFVHTCNRLGQISSPGGVASVDKVWPLTQFFSVSKSLICVEGTVRLRLSKPLF